MTNWTWRAWPWTALKWSWTRQRIVTSWSSWRWCCTAWVHLFPGICSLQQKRYVRPVIGVGPQVNQKSVPFQYFVEYKLGEDYTGIKSDYASNFLAYLGIAAQIPNVLFNWLNIFIEVGWVAVAFIRASSKNFFGALFGWPFNWLGRRLWPNLGRFRDCCI